MGQLLSAGNFSTGSAKCFVLLAKAGCNFLFSIECLDDAQAGECLFDLAQKVSPLSLCFS